MLSKTMLHSTRLCLLVLLIFAGCQLEDPAKPVAKFNMEGDNCVGPCTVTFTNTSENLSVYNWTYTWDFGDNTTSTEPNPKHLYQTSGLFTVTLTLSGKYGIAIDSATVLIQDRLAVAPIPDFIIESENRFVDSVIVFKNTSKNATSYVWNFGDKSADSVSVDPNPSHVFKAKGDYTVRLEAMGPGGKEAISKKITIKGAPTMADFDFKQVEDPNFFEVSFENKSVNALEYKWDFGDKTEPSIEKNPKHKYTRYDADSTYQVKLTAMGADTATKMRSVTIKKKGD